MSGDIYDYVMWIIRFVTCQILYDEQGCGTLRFSQNIMIELKKYTCDFKFCLSTLHLILL